MLKFYYDLMSQPCRAIYILLKASNIPFEGCRVDLAAGEQPLHKFLRVLTIVVLGAHYTDDFKENISRFGKVPVIHDGNFKLTERLLQRIVLGESYFCFFNF